MNKIAEKEKKNTCSEKERESGGEKAGQQKGKEAGVGMRTGNKEEESTKFRKRRELVKSKGIREAVKNVLADFFRYGGPPPPPP